MQANIQREALLERREQNSDVTSTLWARLSLAQKFAASSLSQFGYDLAYIRHSHHGNIAILQCNGEYRNHFYRSEIDTSANIKLRS